MVYIFSGWLLFCGVLFILKIMLTQMLLYKNKSKQKICYSTNKSGHQWRISLSKLWGGDKSYEKVFEKNSPEVSFLLPIEKFREPIRIFAISHWQTERGLSFSSAE